MGRDFSLNKTLRHLLGIKEIRKETNKQKHTERCSYLKTEVEGGGRLCKVTFNVVEGLFYFLWFIP